MATFTYQYRDSSGSLKSDTVEAASRAEAFDILKGRGIKPLRIVDGVRPSATRKIPFRWMAGVACVLACAALVVFVITYLGRKDPAPAQESKEPASKPRGTPPQQKIISKSDSRSKEKAKDPVKPAANAVTEAAEAAPSNAVAVAEEPPPATNKVFHAPSLSKRKVTLMDGTTAELTTRRVFGHDKPLDLQIMAVTKPGGMSSGLRTLRLRYSDDEIVAMLKEPVAFSTDDPEDVRQIKDRVQAQKNIVLDFLKQGGTVTDAIAQMCKAAGSERIDMRNDQIELNKLVKAGDVEAMQQFLKERNASRRELGLPELSLPEATRLQLEAQKSEEQSK